jgi:Flp pilus assembly protein CpaB
LEGTVEVVRLLAVARRLARRSVLWWTAALVVGAVFAARAIGDLDRLHARARAGGRPVTVVVAAHDLTYGAPVAADDLATRTVPEDLVGDDVLRRPADAIGRIVAVPVLAGSVVTERHLAPAERTGLAGVLPADRRLVRVLAEGSVRARPGNIVDVVAVTEAGPPSFVVAGVLVASVDDDDLTGEPAVTVAVAPDEVLALADAAARGRLTIVLAPPEAVASRPR